jgi:hypothetical protein
MGNLGTLKAGKVENINLEITCHDKSDVLRKPE